MQRKNTYFSPARIRNFFVIILALLLLISSFPFFTNSVRASTVRHPEENALIVSAWKHLDMCIQQADRTLVSTVWRSEVTPQQLSSGDTFRGVRGGSALTATGESSAGAGYLLTDGGFYRCIDGGVGDLLGSIGFNPSDIAELFIGTGIYAEAASGIEYQSLGEGRERELIREAFREKFDGISLSNSQPNDVKYSLLLAAFNAECQSGMAVSGGYEVSIVDQATGEIEQQRFFVNDRDSAYVGWGFNDESSADFQNNMYNRHSGSYEIGCADIVTIMNRTAQANSTSILSFLDGVDDDWRPGIGSSSEPRETCADADSWAWLMCPLVSIVEGAFNFLGAQIDAMLRVPLGQYSDSGLREAWAAFRNIAYILLVPIMLVMVISTALGFEFVSAYAVKKALPRMVAATIFIAFSWEIVLLLVNITHALGSGVRGIVLEPFNVESFADLFSAGTSTAAGQWAFLGIGIPIALLSSAVLGILLSFAGTAALILLTIFLFLVARELFIVGLAVVAPIAILSWIFSDRTKLWGAWWRIFWKLLMIYPIISMMTALGLVFASFVDMGTTFRAPASAGFGGGIVAGTADRILPPLLKIAAFIVPYALIPLAFKYVGGVLGNLAGMVNDKEKGAFDRLKQYRRGQYKRAGDEAKSGTLTNKGGQFGERLGRTIGRARSGPRGWMPGRDGRTYSEQYMANSRSVMAAENAKDPRLQQFAVSDDHGNAVLALSGGTRAGAMQAARDLRAGWRREAEERGETLSERELDERENRAFQAASAIGFSKQNAQVAMGTMMQNKARSVAGGDWGTIQAGIDRLHGENTTAAEQQSNYVQYLGREAGRADFGNIGGDGAPNIRGSLERTGVGKVLAGHSGAARFVTQDSASRFNENLGGGGTADTLQAAAELVSYRNASNPNITEENKEAVRVALGQAGVDLQDSASVDQQLARQIAINEGYDIDTDTGRQRAVQLSNEIRNRAAVYEGVDARYRDGGGDGGAAPTGGTPPGGTPT